MAFFACKNTKVAQKEAVPHDEKKEAKAEMPKVEYDYTFFNATKEKLLGNMEIAETLYKKCIDMNKSEADPYYELATIYNYLGQDADAMNYAGKAVKLDPTNNWYRKLYARSLSNNQKYKEAEAQLEKLINADPHNPDYYYLAAGDYTLDNQPQKAIDALDKVEKIIGVTDEISIRKKDLYLKLGKVDKAIAELQSLIKANPDDTKYVGMLGDLYMDNNMPDKAYELYQQILKTNPDDPVIHISLAQYYQSKGDNQKSFDEMKAAFANKNLDIDAKVKILLSYYKMSNDNDSIKSNAFTLAKILVKTDSDEAKAYTIYGDFLYQDKQIKAAREQYRKALTLDKDKYPIWSQVLLIDAQLNDFDAMKKESKDALNYFPNQAALYFFSGLANIQLKQYDDAIDMLKMGRDLVSNNKQLQQQILSNLAEAYYRKGNLKDCFNAFDQALLLDPKDATVLNNYAYYLSEHNQNLAKADSMSAASNKIMPNQSSFEDTYAWIMFQQKKYKDADKWIDKALSNGGDQSGVILEHKGDILYKLGDTDKAVEYWKKAKTKGNASKLIDKKISDKKFYE